MEPNIGATAFPSLQRPRYLQSTLDAPSTSYFQFTDMLFVFVSTKRTETFQHAIALLLKLIHEGAFPTWYIHIFVDRCVDRLVAMTAAQQRAPTLSLHIFNDLFQTPGQHLIPTLVRACGPTALARPPRGVFYFGDFTSLCPVWEFLDEQLDLQYMHSTLASRPSPRHVWWKFSEIDDNEGTTANARQGSLPESMITLSSSLSCSHPFPSPVEARDNDAHALLFNRPVNKPSHEDDRRALNIPTQWIRDGNFHALLVWFRTRVVLAHVPLRIGLCVDEEVLYHQPSYPMSKVFSRLHTMMDNAFKHACLPDVLPHLTVIASLGWTSFCGRVDTRRWTFITPEQFISFATYHTVPQFDILLHLMSSRTSTSPSIVDTTAQQTAITTILRHTSTSCIHAVVTDAYILDFEEGSGSAASLWTTKSLQQSLDNNNNETIIRRDIHVRTEDELWIALVSAIFFPRQMV